MSRIGKKPISIPKGVEVRVDGQLVTVKGPKGELAQEVKPFVNVSASGGEIHVGLGRGRPSRGDRAFQGLYRALLRNMVEGVEKGYTRVLEIVGVGYNAKLQVGTLVLQVGFSHPVKIEVPEGLTVETPTPTRIVVRGCDKQKVGQFAADVRRARPPEAYKGKGIRYEGELVRQKAGKSFVSGGG